MGRQQLVAWVWRRGVPEQVEAPERPPAIEPPTRERLQK